MSVRIPPHLFGIPFGITGLAEAWTAAVSLAATVALGGWLTGRWMTGLLDRDRVHPELTPSRSSGPSPRCWRPSRPARLSR